MPRGAATARVVACLVLAFGSACRPASNAHGAIVRVDGSSTVYPLTEAVAEDFQRDTRGARVTVGVAGTGGGFKKFCRGESDISNASRPISAIEREACRTAGIEYFEVPVAYDGITVAVHPDNTWCTDMTVEELGRLWRHQAEGRLTRWSQLRTGFPDAEIRLFGAGADSGTFDYFTEAVTGTARDSRGDFTSSEDDNVLVQGVSGDRYALGFFGYAYYEENRTRLRAVAVVPEDGAPAVAPTPATIRDGTYRPLSRPVFIYVSAAAYVRPEVRAFVEYYLTHGGALAREVGYVPLNERAAEAVRARVTRGVTGTLYAAEHASATALDRLLGLQ